MSTSPKFWTLKNGTNLKATYLFFGRAVAKHQVKLITSLFQTQFSATFPRQNKWRFLNPETIPDKIGMLLKETVASKFDLL